MKKETTGKQTTILINVSLILFVIGSIFGIQHWPYGSVITVIGLCSFIFMNTLEIRRLKKITGSSNPMSLSLFLFMLCGAYRMLRYPYGDLIFILGIGSYIFISQIEINRLNKMVAGLSGEGGEDHSDLN